MELCPTVPWLDMCSAPILLLLLFDAPQVYLIRDEPRTRTARSDRHTLVTAYQFANSSVSEEEFTGKAITAMGGGGSGEYDWLGLEPTAKLLEVETASDYFPHFSQVKIIYFSGNRCRVFSSRSSWPEQS